MAMTSAFQELRDKLLELHSSVRELAVSVAEDKPLDGDVLLADRLSDTVQDLQGWLDEALSAADTAHQVTIHPADLETARQCLVNCQERFGVFTQRFVSELAQYDRLAELMQLGHERKGEWQAWARIVRGNIERCQFPLHEITQTLFRCWQELADQSSKQFISVKTNGIGNQINHSVPATTTTPSTLERKTRLAEVS